MLTYLAKTFNDKLLYMSLITNLSDFIQFSKKKNSPCPLHAIIPNN